MNRLAKQLLSKEQTASNPKWSGKFPKQAGYYWLYRRSDPVPLPVEVSWQRFGGAIMATVSLIGTDVPFYKDEMGGAFWLPLPMPDDPQLPILIIPPLALAPLPDPSFIKMPRKAKISG